MNQVAQVRASLEDLYRYPGKAELIGGRIVPCMATGRLPNRVAGRIYRELADYAEERNRGEACTDNMGFAVAELPSGRESFSPDAAYYDGPLPANPMRFIEGAPNFAAEVRIESDCTPSAEAEMAEKRSDYFAAGTQVVWDVDPIAACVHVYRRAAPELRTTYVRGQFAEAEPALPGWRISVDRIFS